MYGKLEETKNQLWMNYLTDDEKKHLADLQQKYNVNIEQDSSLLEEIENITKNAKIKHFKKLYEQYMGHSVYIKNSHKYGRIIGIECYNDEVCYVNVKYFNLDLSLDDNNASIVGSYVVRIDDVELIGYDIYEHMFKRFKEVCTNILYMIPDWQLPNNKDRINCYESNGYHESDMYLGEELDCKCTGTISKTYY